MRSGMYISTILDFHRFIRRLYKAPEFILYVVLGYERISNAIHRRVIKIRGRWGRWRMRGPPSSAKLKVARLETRQAVFLSFIKTKITTSAKEADMAEPLPLWNRGQRGVKAKYVESCDNKLNVHRLGSFEPNVPQSHPSHNNIFSSWFFF